MASITNEPNGRKVIQFFGQDGKRRSLRLGKVSQRNAEQVKFFVEDLAAAAATGSTPTRKTLLWVADLGDAMHAKLAAVGLVEPRASGTLLPFINGWIEGREDVKESTRTVYKRTRKHLVAFFGADRDLRSITPGDADSWRQYLLSGKKGKKPLSENTTRKSCSIAKQFFRAAERLQLIDANPFAELVSEVRGNASRFAFITREQAGKVLDACPDAEWRLIFALARYGGLRVPSEAMLLRWQDVDWANNRFTVRSPKTEHHEGRASRVVPIFPELLPYLRESFDLAKPGTVYCITPRGKGAAVNLRTHLGRIIDRAGVERWPKLWQNLRSTRQTELAGEFPDHVACAWIGNSKAVAMRHYLQVTEADYAKAAGPGEAVQNPVQHVHAGNCTQAHVIFTDEPQTSEVEAVSSDVQLCAAECTEAEKVGEWAVLDSNQRPSHCNCDVLAD